ncbi:hypothetical protein DPMN_040963 [Dreissena polymorpha]|uniref:Uncharacterized protein n=1 Tax=Dreissena polymorpha TaxID=45954 RepID=A0A9D4CYK7_DREPO|nr:hypothetical protein DPMN_040963 [Dreissena polymorpha]
MRDDIDRAVRDIDTTFAEIVYYGFVAYFASTDERTFSSAVNHIRHVGVLSDQCANPFLRTVSSLFQHYTYRRLCCGTARVNVNRNVNFGTHDYMEKSLKQFELAADCVGREFANDEALRSYVHCWYLMNTVQSYLLITNEFEVDTDTVPGKMSMALVKNYLGIIETKLSGMEKRQKIKYYMCRARESECNSDVDMALSYTRKAMANAYNGTYCPSDRDNISQYHRHLEQLSKKYSHLLYKHLKVLSRPWPICIALAIACFLLYVYTKYMYASYLTRSAAGACTSRPG